MSGLTGEPAAYDQEKVTPYFDSTRFDEFLVHTELALASRAGCFRFTFIDGKAALAFRNHQTGNLKMVVRRSGPETKDLLEEALWGIGPCGGGRSSSGTSAIGSEENIYGMKAYMYAALDNLVSIQMETVRDGNRALISVANVFVLTNLRVNNSYKRQATVT
jgi:hypothetical protein